MPRKNAHLDFRVEPAIIERIDAWRDQQRIRPTRTDAVVYMIDTFLTYDEAGGVGQMQTGWPPQA